MSTCCIVVDIKISIGANIYGIISIDTSFQEIIYPFLRLNRKFVPILHQFHHNWGAAFNNFSNFHIKAGIKLRLIQNSKRFIGKSSCIINLTPVVRTVYPTNYIIILKRFNFLSNETKSCN